RENTMKEFGFPEQAAPSIGASLSRYQQSLVDRGQSFSEAVRASHVEKWTSASLAHVLRIRTALVLGLQEYLVSRGIMNIDRVSLSPVTDPLCHDVEHAPIIMYQQSPYRTTHSMIYSKMLACMNPLIDGVYIDSPNIRLELPSSQQRHKYLIDFSQMDIEFKRWRQLTEEDYFDRPAVTSAALEEERDRALDFFEDLIIYAVKKILALAEPDLEALGVTLAVPQKPFPRFFKDEQQDHESKSLEARLGQAAGVQFFWVLGLLRENYDLVYPFLSKSGDIPSRASISSRQIYNYDLCAAPLYKDGTLGQAYEVLSGGLREWVYDAIVARLLDNGILKEAPRFDAQGNITNMEALEGYGPFLAVAHLRDASGKPYFPQTCGGGLGIERSLFALLHGPEIQDIDQVTCFGKNPDKELPFLF
ncbi:MAG: hypothetical protein QHH01_07865, partial [Spirochaetales bacterium]|nr:hypothetical protein [Spirochaetales bacterium]